MNKIKDYLYIFQLEGYDKDRFLNWLSKNKNAKIIQEKKKIEWTSKAKILYGLSFVINFLIFGNNPARSIILSNRIFTIPESLIKNLIIFLAKNKIKKYPNLIVIGITGSYGKTSVKEILSHFLSVKYKVLKTPESYNTPLGVSRIILNSLKRKHQIFIVEMGAYQKNDINILCDIVKPKYGIITAIGKQHLERFGNEENVLKTKFELVSSLSSGGAAFLNGNDKKIVEEAKKHSNCKIYFFGIIDKKSEKNPRKFYLAASNIETTSSGTVFDLYPINNNRGVVRISTPLLGKHNVVNIAAAGAVAYYLGISLEEISKLCSTLSSIPHRLQIIPGANNTTIIDDSFNANPDSVKAALEVLKDFPSDCKIIITPGLIELGDEQYEENETMGEEMAKVADYIIVVGETNRKALAMGMKKVKSMIVNKLDEAIKKLPDIIVTGAVILFENDLPDQYK